MENVIEKVWTKSKVLIKAVIILALVLLFLIPTAFIQDLIREREARQKEAVEEISSKWGGKQNVMGPVLVLPFTAAATDSIPAKHSPRRFAYFLPDELKINGVVDPIEKYRGIYKVMLYASNLNISGSFRGIHLEQLHIDPKDIIWDEAFLQVNIADLKGLNEEIPVKWNNQSFILSPGTEQGSDPEHAMVAQLKLNGPDELTHASFSIDLHLNGSEQLLFTPTGSRTTVMLHSKWPHPGFTGGLLPYHSEVKDSGFTASWKTLEQKMNLPHQWIDQKSVFYNPNQKSGIPSTSFQNAAFGTNLYMPVNDYQKIMRSIKYAVLCILLTFAAFFLIETNYKKSVHPFHYGLVGVALLLFYTLLLSFSEYAGFNISYCIASVATIGLIAWFVKGLLESSRLSLLLSVVLVLLYSYVFTILQLQDYSLLLGSIGLFLTLAVIMHFSKKIKW